MGVLIVTTTADHNPAPLAATIGGDPPCTVTYRIGTDGGATFTGTLTLDSDRDVLAGGWSVAFDLADSQTFQAAAPATSTQHDGHVEVHFTGRGTGTVSAPFTGGYRGTNPMPATFTAGARPCSPVLIGPNGTVQAAPAVTPSSTSDHGTGAPIAAHVGSTGQDVQNTANTGGNGPKPRKGKGKGKGNGNG